MNLSSQPRLAMKVGTDDIVLACTRIMQRDTRRLRERSSIIQLNKASSMSESSAFLPAPSNRFFLDLPLVFSVISCSFLTPFSNSFRVYTKLSCSSLFRFFIRETDSLELKRNVVRLAGSLNTSSHRTYVYTWGWAGRTSHTPGSIRGPGSIYAMA